MAGGRLAIGVLAHFAAWSSMNDQRASTCKTSSRRRPGSSQILEAPYLGAKARRKPKYLPCFIDMPCVLRSDHRSIFGSVKGALMLAVTVSPKFQVVIPQSIREQLKIKAGHKLQVLAYENRIELLPIEMPRVLRGFLPGIATDVPREDDRV